ncbi:hypothetical protein ACFWQL_22480 [Amycolatopsis thermoflava]|uniref:hypothetical protein n=1 Tax=Amycolatopsis thermoflava TaxID=84480 RepID=UPI00365A50BD
MGWGVGHRAGSDRRARHCPPGGREQARRERLEAAEREIAQARLVIAEVTYPQQRYDGYDPDLIVVRIHNYSASPISFPRLGGFVHPHVGRLDWVIGDSDMYERAPSLLPAGSNDPVPFVRVTYDPPLPEEQRWPDDPVIGFSDTEGRRWRRRGTHAPYQPGKDDPFEVTGPDWYRVR